MLLGVVYVLNTIFCEQEELGLARQLGIERANLNNTLKRAKVGISFEVTEKGHLEGGIFK